MMEKPQLGIVPLKEKQPAELLPLRLVHAV